jgi:archaemetzincin
MTDASRAGVGLRAPARMRLVVLDVEPLEPGEVEWLGEALASRLGARVTVETVAGAASAFGADGGQLDSGAIVDYLIERFPAAGPNEWILAVTAADLRGGGREFVFGEAAQGGGWAVVGSARFGARGDAHFRRRLLRESLHELGHLAGLGHCDQPGCLMSPSTAVAEVDRKEDVLCAVCRASVGGDGT